MIVVRYADDFVVGFQYRWEAESFMDDLRERLAKFGLEMHPGKTRLIEFGRFARVNRKSRRQGKPETFEPLGMTHFCAKTLKGKFRVGRKPSRDRVRRTLRRIKDELRKRRHMGKYKVTRWLGRVINGWLNYYAVPGTSRALKAFVRAVRHMFLRALRRRSQKDRYQWSALDRLIGFHWPKPTIRRRGRPSALPSTPKAGAGCVSAQVRISTGGAGQPAFLPRFGTSPCSWSPPWFMSPIRLSIGPQASFARVAAWYSCGRPAWPTSVRPEHHELLHATFQDDNSARRALPLECQYLRSPVPLRGPAGTAPPPPCQ